MKNQFLHHWMISVIFLLSIPNSHFAQTPDLGTTANYVLFTAEGALGNTGTSVINGNIGTNLGAITGFELPTVVNGTIEAATTATAQAKLDVQVAYNQLMAIPATVTNHAPVFGNGETILPGVYYIGGAGSTAGTLILDGQGNSNAVFVFQFMGAFTTAAATTVVLINGASASNIFWGANGAIAMAANTTMYGTLIASNAISLAAGGALVGRMLSVVGAVAVDNVVITQPGFALPIELLTFTGSCTGQHVVLNWTTATENNNDYFTVERRWEGQNWQKVDTIDGAGNSASIQKYTFTDKQPGPEETLYRLKQTDFNAIYQYGVIIVVKKCGEVAGTVTVYPNPSSGRFIVFISGDLVEINSIELFNVHGQKVYAVLLPTLNEENFTTTIELPDELPMGIYFIKIDSDNLTYTQKFMVRTNQ